MFFFMFLVSNVRAQDGYLVYQGPTDSQSYHKGTVKKSYKKAGNYTRVKKTAKVRRNTNTMMKGDSLYDRPEYPGYIDRRFEENPMGYSGYVENGRPVGRLSASERLMAGEDRGFEAVHIGHRRAIMPNEAGNNAEFLASVTPGYMKTRQIDIIGPDMYVWESGIDVPKRYKVQYQPNERVMIRDLHGHKAANGIIEGRDGTMATLSLMSGGKAVPLHVNRYLTETPTWDVSGASGRNK